MKYQNKQLTARKENGHIVAYIGIIDTDAYRKEKELMAEAGIKTKQNYYPPEDAEQKRIAAILRGEGK